MGKVKKRSFSQQTAITSATLLCSGLFCRPFFHSAAIQFGSSVDYPLHTTPPADIEFSANEKLMKRHSERIEHNFIDARLVTNHYDGYQGALALTAFVPILNCVISNYNLVN